MANTNRKISRLRRAGKTRAKIRRKGTPRLLVSRSNQHTTAQLIEHNEQGDIVIASASTMQMRDKKGTKMELAAAVGKALAAAAKKKKTTQVAFDRSGYKYHGRVKAVADAAREAGMEF